MNNDLSIIKKFLFFISGAFAAGVVQDLIAKDFKVEDSSALLYLGIVAIAFILTLLGYSLPNDLKTAWFLWRRKHRNKFLIGIISDSKIPWEEDKDRWHTWTMVSPKAWSEKFNEVLSQRYKKLDFKVEFVDFTSNLHKYNVILNPYGGVYRDKDLSERPVLKHIIEFVNKGGIFINTSDTPFYWTYRDELKTTSDAGSEGVIVAFNQTVPFQSTVLLKELNIWVTQGYQEDVKEYFVDSYKDLEQEQKPNILITKEAPVKGNVESILQTKNRFNHEMTALFWSKYGNGKFLISLIPLFNTDNPEINDNYLPRILNLIPNLIGRELASYKK